MKRRILALLLTLVMVFLALPITLFAVVAEELDPIVELEFSNDDIRWDGAFRPSGYFDATKSVKEENGETFYSFTITKRGSNKGVGTNIIVNDGKTNVSNMNYVLVDYRYIMAERGVNEEGATLAYPADGTKWYLLVVLDDGTEYGFDCDTIISDNGMDTSGQWATMKFNISNILDDAVIKELWIYPYVANQAEITSTNYPARPRGQTVYDTSTGAQSTRIAYEKGDIIDIKSVSYLITCWATLDFDGTVLDHSEYAVGDSYVLPEPNASKRGYDFVGWSDGTNFYNVGDAVILSQNTTFSAVFVQKPIHTVTAVNEGKIVSSTSIIDGETYTLPVMQRKDGYDFVGWFDGVNTYDAREVITVTSNMTFTAVFKLKNVYDVTVISDGNTLDSAKVIHGLTYTLPEAQEKYGYTFKGWSDGVNTYAAGTKLTIKNTTTFTAVFEQLPIYSVTVVADGTTVDNTTRITGETYILPEAPVKYGHTFKGWTDGTNTYAAGAELTITQSVSFAAIFSENAKYIATIVSDGVTTETVEVYAGEYYTLPEAPTKEGYIFSAWSDGRLKFAAGEKVKLTVDTTYTAIFVQEGSSRESYEKYVNPFTFNGTAVSSGTGNHLRIGYTNYGTITSFTDENGKSGTKFVEDATRYTVQLSIGKSYFPDNVTVSFDVYFNDLPTFEEGKIGIFTDRGHHKSSLAYTVETSWIVVWTDENGKSWASMQECDEPFEVKAGQWYTFKFFGSKSTTGYIQGWVKELGGNYYTYFGRYKGCSYINAYNKALFAFYNNSYASYTVSDFLMTTREDEHFIKLDGVQYSDAQDGKYNVRFAAALSGLVDGQSAVGFEVVCGELGKKWTMETTKVYTSILSNYGHDKITAADIGGAYISTFTLKNIPVSAGKISLVCTPYVVVDGVKYYGSSVTVVHDPAAQN